MKLSLTTFRGTAPRLDPSRLPAGMAVTASGCRVDRGVLQSEKEPAFYADRAISATVKTLYRYGGDTDPATGYLFQFDEDVSVVRAPLPENPSDIVLLTGDGYPKITDHSIALASQPYPSQTWRLGVPQPSSSPSVTVEGTKETEATAYDRDYVITYLCQMGALVMEGKPCTPSVSVEVAAGQYCELTGIVQPSAGEYNFIGKRLYRRTNYAGAGSFVLVAELDISTATYTDTLADTELPGDVLATHTLDADMPPETLQDMVALPNGLCAGSDGVAVHVSHAYLPHSWSAFNRYPTVHPIVGLGRFDNTIVALTEKNPVLITGTSASTLYAQELQLHQGCVSRGSIVSGAFGVVYASPDGLVIVSPQGMDIATRDLVDRQRWQELNPSSIRACLFEGAYLGAFTRTDNTHGLFLFDPRKREQGLIFYEIEANALYHDALADTVFLAMNDKINLFRQGDEMPFVWRSAILRTLPVKLSACRIEHEGSLVFRLFRDGSEVMETTVSDGAFRLPAGFGEQWQIELEGTGKVFSVTLASSMGEL